MVAALLPGQARGQDAGRTAKFVFLLDIRSRLSSYPQNTTHLRNDSEIMVGEKKKGGAFSVSERPIFDILKNLLGPWMLFSRSSSSACCHLPPPNPWALEGKSSHWPWVTCPAAWSSRLGVSPMPASSAGWQQMKDIKAKTVIVCEKQSSLHLLVFFWKHSKKRHIVWVPPGSLQMLH